MIADLALILICAGVMTLLFKWLKQPLVLGYIVAGFLASPNMPYMPSVTDIGHIHLWSDIGVIFLLFALGLEFSFKKILKMGSAPIIAACTIIMMMMATGYTTGQLFGWGQMDCIFLGGMLAMSSTTIIFKAFDDMGLRQQRFASMVLSVLIIEDILAIVMMVMLSTLAVSQKFEGMQMISSIAKLVFFLVLWFVVGLYAVPLFLRKMRRLLGDETLLIVALGMCFGMVVLASAVGFSPAFGAFIMGSILAETLEATRIEHLVDPVKNLFGAIFFVSVGMMVDVSLIIEYAVPIVCIIAAIMVGQTLFGTAGFLLAGQPLKVAMQCSFSLTQIGEFAFILATLGTSLNVTSDYLYPIVVAVSVFTTFTTPYMIRLAVPTYNAIERRLPGSWKKILERYASGAPTVSNQSSYWRTYLINIGQTVLIYSVLCWGVVIVMERFVAPHVLNLLSSPWAEILLALGTIMIISPFLRLLMVKHNHSKEFYTLWNEHYVNRAPLIAVHLFRVWIVASLVGYVVSETMQWRGWMLFTVVAAVILSVLMNRSVGLRAWRLEQTFADNLNAREHGNHPQFAGSLVERDMHLSDYIIPVGNAWGGLTLAELSLGHRYGVHVASIQRGNERIDIPSGSTRILPGDRLTVIGSDAQLSTFGTELEAQGQKTSNIEPSEMKLRRIVVNDKSPLVGKNMQENGIREHYHTLVVGMEAEGSDTLLAANPQTPLQGGDILWVVGDARHLMALEHASQAA